MQDGRIAAFMAALLAERDVPAEPAGPLVPVYTPMLARSLGFYRDVMGFDVATHVPHVLAVLRLAGANLLLQQLGPAGAAFRPATYRVLAPRLHALHRALRPGLVRSGQAGAIPSWQPWQAWELRWQDGDGNGLVFLQPGASAEDAGPG